MVQRKVPNKHSIQHDHIKIENPLKNLKPSSFFKDMNNKGATDLKKKMKKSGSLKRNDFDTLLSPNKKRNMKQPGNPAPPNYMKSTTSSDSRKEQSQSPVSTKSIQNTPCSSKNSNTSVASGNKITKTFAGTSSLKLMRSLTKTPSFKPARVSMKKRSQVALCENLDVQRATCSSTQKDCKVPAYLMLNPGGTEVEGTSVFKVCPYTYCSLNGHFHAPSPPLKGYLSAKRRMIKNQRNIKMESLDKKLENQGDLNISTFSPLIQEEGGGFFIEIYGGKMEKERDYAGIDRSGSCSSIVDLMEADQEEQLLEKHSDGLVCNEFDSRENFDSEGSDVEWKKGHYSAVYLDDDGEYSSKTEKEVDLTGGADESIIGICLDGFGTDGESPEVFDEVGLSIDALSSSNDDCESVGSFEYPESLNNFKNLESREEMVICGDERVQIGVEGHLSDEYQIINDENHEKECNPTENFESLSPVEHTKEPNSEATEMNSDESNRKLLNNSLSSTEPATEPNPEATEMTYSDDSNQELLNIPSSPIEPAKEPNSEVIEVNSADSDQELLTKSLSHMEPAKEPNSEATEIDSVDSNKESLNNSVSPVEPAKAPNSHDLNQELLNNSLSPIEPPKEPNSEANEMKHPEDSNQQLLTKSLSPIKPPQKPNSETTHTDSHYLNQELLTNYTKPRHNKPILDIDNDCTFNPREPNFLPLESDPDSEKVDLRHQEMDDKKNSEEWMVDYALRQTVTKLGRARKKKVALLVEAFEKVMPMNKYEVRSGGNGSAFDHARQMQACN